MSDELGDAALNRALAAAVAAAAEIAKNGGTYLYDPQSGEAKNASKIAHDSLPMIVAGASAALMVSKPQQLSPAEQLAAPTMRSAPSVVSKSTTGDDPIIPSIIVDAEKRLARSRERNREHARRTRLRKKAQLEALQARVTELEEENRVLKQGVEECSIASILVGLSSGTQQAATDSLLEDATNVKKDNSPRIIMSGGKRKRFVPEDGVERQAQPLKLEIDGQTTLFGGGKTHINWKSGVYYDEDGVQRQLTQEQLETLRRERNRMHAKMTRDRKKCFISSVKKKIKQLESENERMREALTTVSKTEVVTPSASPIQTSMDAPTSVTPDIQEEPLGPQVSQQGLPLSNP